MTTVKLDHTLGAARALLDGLPDDTPVRLLQLEDPRFVIIVDSLGNAQRIVTKARRWLILHVEVSISS